VAVALRGPCVGVRPREHGHAGRGGDDGSDAPTPPSTAQASSRFVRASRFRHVFAEPAKPELHYTDLDLSPVTGDHSYIKGNGKYFVVAVRGGGGPVQVVPYTQVRAAGCGATVHNQGRASASERAAG